MNVEGQIQSVITSQGRIQTKRHIHGLNSIGLFCTYCITVLITAGSYGSYPTDLFSMLIKVYYRCFGNFVMVGRQFWIECVFQD